MDEELKSILNNVLVIGDDLNELLINDDGSVLAKDTLSILSNEISSYFSDSIKIIRKNIIENKINLYPDKFRLSNEIWSKCRKLSNMGFIIGGSTVLKLYGLVNREIDDIDIWISSNNMKFSGELSEGVILCGKKYNVIDSTLHKNESDPFLSLFGEIDIEDGYDMDNDNERFKIEIDDIGLVDIFNDKANYQLYDGIRIRSPFNSISAKIKYNRLKDIKDFVEISRNLYFYQ